MTRISIINGPNLNLLGTREPDVYGSQTLADIEALCREAAAVHGFDVDFMQSNHEGDLIDAIHAAGGSTGIILNAGAYTHTSVALRDAISAVSVPVVEVHLSNTHAREEFRHHSFISPVAKAVILGAGAQGYRFAIELLAG